MTQILIGTGLCIPILVLLSVVHKKRRMVWVSMSVFFAVILAGGIVMAASGLAPLDVETGKYAFFGSDEKESKSSRKSDRKKDRKSKKDDEDESNEENYLDIVRYLMDEGDLDTAKNILNECASVINYNGEYLEVVADLYDLTDYSDRANRITDALKDFDIETGDSKRKLNSDSVLAAQAFSAIRALTAMENGNGYYSNEDKEEMYSYIEDWADSGFPLSGLPSLRKAVLAADLLMGEYNSIAQAVMNDPDADTLLIASQLSRKGYLKDSDIADSYISEEDKAAGEKVAKYLEKQQKNKKDYTEEEISYIEAQRDLIEKTLEGDIDLRTLLDDKMKKEAERDRSGASKLFLELADIAYSENDEQAASEYVRRSLEESTNSDDPDYYNAARDIREVFSSNDPEGRKKLPDYIERLTENRMPDNMPSIDTDVLNGIVEVDGPDIDDDEDYGQNNGDRGNTWGGNDVDHDDDEYVPEDDDPGDPNLPDDPDVINTSDRSLEDNLNDTINQVTGSVNIVSIDTSNFPALSVVVAADESLVTDAESFKAHMKMSDVGISIDDYTVEKINYSTVNVLLVCDDSGSMEGGPRDDLCNAVKSFVNSSDSDVNIGFVSFSSGVNTESVAPLGSSRDVLINAADGLRAEGGTNIYDAVVYGQSMFPQGSDNLNIMILMSDGQDDMPSPEQFAQLSSNCVSRNISVYAVGLGGGVDADLLSQYAGFCGGSYFYVNSSESISSFYDFIYGIGKNRYKVTFNAVDEFQIDRFMDISFDGSSVIRDTKTYSLFRNDIEDSGSDNNCNVSLGGVIINGLREKMIYPTDYEQVLTLLGSGFEENATISVELHGATTYTCTVEYVDSTKVNVRVPADVATGVYDVYITYNGKRAVFGSGLVVSGGDTNVIRFGEYVFTASNIAEGNNTVTMSGVVMLNDWLGFRDPVTLTGDLANDYNVNMDFGRTYMYYTDTSAPGLAGYYAKLGYMSQLTPFGGSVRLYNDQTKAGSSDDYPVDVMPVVSISVRDLFTVANTFSTGGLSIYPDRAKLDFDAFTTEFPFQDIVLSDVTGQIFNFDLDSDAALIYSKNAVDCDLEVTIGEDNGDDITQLVKVGNQDVKLGTITLKLNTMEGTGSIKAKSDVASLFKGVNFEIAMKDWKLDKVMFGTGGLFKINVYIYGIPVITIDDFKLGVEDLSRLDTNDWSTILYAELVGSADVSLAKISSICPGLENFIDDVALLKLDDLTLAIRLREFRIRSEATVKLLKYIEIGKASLQLGFGVDYDNPLFILQDQPNGFVTSVTQGFKIESDIFLYDISGTTNIAITDQAIGLWTDGDFHTKIGWWVFVDEAWATGDTYIGWYKQQNGKLAFAVLVHGAQSDGKQIAFQVVWGEDDNAYSSFKF